MKLQRRGVQTLAQAMQVAESLIEFKRVRDSSRPNDKRGKPTKGRGEKENPFKEPHLSRHLRRTSSKARRQPSKEVNILLCGDPHKAMDCPKRANLAALVQREEEKQQEETRLHSHCLLNAIKTGG